MCKIRVARWTCLYRSNRVEGLGMCKIRVARWMCL